MDKKEVFYHNTITILDNGKEGGSKMEEEQEVMQWAYIRFSLATRCVKDSPMKSMKNECDQMSYRKMVRFDFSRKPQSLFASVCDFL